MQVLHQQIWVGDLSKDMAPYLKQQLALGASKTPPEALRV